MRSLAQHLRLPLARRRSPITLLPVELIEIIFGFYAHSPEIYPNTHMGTLLDKGVSTFSSQTNVIVNPVVLSQVNRLWRQISLALPLLWSRMYICHPTEEHVELAARWLSLAGSQPLTLHVSSFWGKPSRAEISAMGGLLEVCLSSYDTWATIDFHLSHFFYPVFLRIPDYPPPILQSVHLNIGKPFPLTPRDERAVDILHSSPSLQRIDWGASCYSVPEALELFQNWTNLKHFVHWQASLENSLTVNDCITLLHACPSLESFEAKIYPPDDRQLPAFLLNFLPLIHPRLHVLSISTSPRLLSQLLDSLALPALETLSIYHFIFIRDAYDTTLITATPILDLLSRSSVESCTIREFNLLTPSTPEQVILDIISSPQLRTLRKINISGLKTSHTLELLTRKRDDPQSLLILPCLEEITFYNHSSFSTLDASTSVIMRMLKSRRNRSPKQNSPSGMSLLKYANLGLGELDFWEYRQLKNLGSVDFTIIPTRNDLVPTLRDWIPAWLRDWRLRK
ncbi:hypothetical protein GALMADRAFT_228740 [Galerina marginata CBS 339.88]|uniref:F-box domain-containing protein n=1 Tax=Galerina marginata (strain CBS 339.88) TaxID=685588 RepID=A0A067SSP4_GALM3|nr:hypothetical protein GALMADRAFT_228740 [Galerina marginata CBS 339.88]